MTAGRTHRLTVSEEHQGERLDRWLARQEFIPSRSRAADLIDRGLVTLGGKPLKPSHKVQAHARIEVTVPAPEPAALLPLDRPLEILYQDGDLAVIDKPSGLVVHPAAGHSQDTLVNILLHHVGHLAMGFGEKRPGVVHRLDRDTSGVLVVAKNDFAHHRLASQFKDKSVHRVYWAIVHGVPSRPKGTIITHLARHPTDRKRFASHPGGLGKRAVTHWEVLESVPARLSWVRCRLETGRTHQIRVHLSEAGHPIAGDVVYGRGKSGPGRLALHACELGFTHPRTGEKMFFHRPWPAELAAYANAKGFTHVQS